MRRFVAAAFAAVTVGCAQSTTSPPETRFVHAIAPDLAGTEPAPPGSPPLAEDKALEDLLGWLRAGPPDGPQAEFLVLTGDFGIGKAAAAEAAAAATAKPAETAAAGATTAKPVDAAAAGATTAKPVDAASAGATAKPADPAAAKSAEWERKQADRIAGAFKSAPSGLAIFVVPGSLAVGAKDVAESLARDQRIFVAVARQLEPASIAFRDLSRCYTNPSDLCAARVPGTRIRLVGYPSYLVRVTAADGTLPAGTAETTKIQQEWLNRLEIAFRNPEPGVATVLVSPLSEPLPGHWATEELAQRFERLTIGNIAAGFAIHRTSTSRFVYEPQGRSEPLIDATASAMGRLLVDQRRIFTAPPLVLPRPWGRGQPQGISLVSVSSTGVVSRRLHWYDPGATPFAATNNAGAVPPAAEDLSLWAVLRPSALWRIDRGSLTNLQRSTLFGIALIAAFLTVIAVWQIPPAASDLAPQAAAAGATAATAAAPASSAATTGDQLRETFLGTRFARTVISGFAGLAAVKLIFSTLLGGSAPDADAYYVVWFVLLFFLFQFLSAVLRGGLEVARASIFLAAPADLVPARRSDKSRGARTWRMYVLTFGDAFMNVIQGRNELKSAVWGETIVNLQEDIVLAADRIRESIKTAVQHILEVTPLPPATPVPPVPPVTAVPPVLPATPVPPATPATPVPSATPVPPVPPATPATATDAPRFESSDVRVAISVLSDDRKQVFYISWPADSLNRGFGIKSVAWIAIAGGSARWWKKDKKKEKVPNEYLYGPSLTIYNNKEKQLPDISDIEHKFGDYLANRDQDYKGFVVIPVPFRRRGDAENLRRGGIHISVKHEAQLDALFSKDLDGEPDPFIMAPELIRKAAPPLGDVLNQATKVLAELLRDFNELVYLRQIRPRRRL